MYDKDPYFQFAYKAAFIKQDINLLDTKGLNEHVTENICGTSEMRISRRQLVCELPEYSRLSFA